MRIVALAAGVLLVFAGVSAIMWRFMPEPLKDSDYLVIGSVATLVALLVLFFGLVGTSIKGRDTFFKRRKKPR
jgi:ABC-type Fe3+-siderophore transport system permease subunit